jgi:hypothetical protein
VEEVEAELEVVVEAEVMAGMKVEVKSVVVEDVEAEVDA